MRAALVVPMLAGARVIGTLALVSAESGRRFEPRDVELAEELARRAGTAVENARLYTERSHIARALQTGLLPDALPTIPGWRMEALYRPAGAENWVGGDFYDAVEVPGGWLVLVGDVAGHGAEAAALTGLARHTLRSTARLLADPLDAIAQLNQELTARKQMSLCTVAAVLLTERDGAAQAEIVCAGHPPPLLIADGHVAPVGRFGPMLGAYREERWEPALVSVDPGARARPLHRRRARHRRRTGTPIRGDRDCTKRSRASRAPPTPSPGSTPPSGTSNSAPKPTTPPCSPSSASAQQHAESSRSPTI